MGIYIILIAIILAAATGFKSTIAMFGYGLAVNLGIMHVSEGMHWVGSPLCLVLLFLAMIVELGLGFIPYLDHVFDVVLLPVVIIAGTLMVSSSSSLGETEPLFRWSLGILLGGGPAAVSHLCTAFLRGCSTLSTGGLANFLVHLGEIILAAVTVVIALVIPIIALFLIIAFFGLTLIVYICTRKEAEAH